MSRTYLILAVLMTATLALHLFGGGPEFAAPFAVELAATPKLAAMALVLWHTVSVTLAIQALAYVSLALRPNPPLFWLVLVMQLGWAALFLIYGQSWLGEVRSLAQWTLFLAFPVLALVAEALRRRQGGVAVLPAE